MHSVRRVLTNTIGFLTRCLLARRHAWQEVSNALETLSGILGEGKPVLVTGPAACGKSTLTKQHVYHLATEWMALSASGSDAACVPLLVTVIELAGTIQRLNLGPDEDILAKHVECMFESNKPLVEFVMRARDKHQLVVVLDGMDEAGSVRTVLEPYVADRLSVEVTLLLTGRENGINDMDMFNSFAHFHIQPLNDAQQVQIATGRMKLAAVRKGEVTLEERVAAFMDEVRRSFADVGRTPLLLNLLLSEHLRHEALDAAIQCDAGFGSDVRLYPPACETERYDALFVNERLGASNS